MKKYKLIESDFKIYNGIKLFRIKALMSFGSIKKGDVGGYIESEQNLGMYCNAWVSGDAKVFDNARVFDGANVYDNARVFGNAKVFNDAKVFGSASVYNNAKVYDAARVFGDTRICDNANVYGSAWVYGNAWVCGDTLVYGNANVYGNAWVCSDKITTILKTIMCFRHCISITDNFVFCGCMKWKHNEIKGLKYDCVKEHISEKQFKIIKKVVLELIKY